MQEGACLPLFVFLSRHFSQPLLRHEERVSFYVRDCDVEAKGAPLEKPPGGISIFICGEVKDVKRYD